MAAAGMVCAMTRAHLSMHLSALFVAAAALAGAACNSDDREQLTGTTAVPTTEVDPTEVPTFTTGEPDDTTSTTEVPIPPQTCRDGVFCAVQCAIAAAEKTNPEDDWQSCFFTDCLELLTTEEWLLLFDLGECAVDKCQMTPECMSGSDDCNLCYFSTLGNMTLPPGDPCEAQAKACD